MVTFSLHIYFTFLQNKPINIVGRNSRWYYSVCQHSESIFPPMASIVFYMPNHDDFSNFDINLTFEIYAFKIYVYHGIMDFEWLKGVESVLWTSMRGWVNLCHRSVRGSMLLCISFVELKLGRDQLIDSLINQHKIAESTFNSYDRDWTLWIKGEKMDRR